MASQHTAPTASRAGSVTTTTPAARAQSVVAASPLTFRGKKRPTSPATTPATQASGNNSKKRKAPPVTTPTQAQVLSGEAINKCLNNAPLFELACSYVNFTARTLR